MTTATPKPETDDPEELVELARAEDHPLHEHFEWDDEEAARKHREATAAEHAD